MCYFRSGGQGRLFKEVPRAENLENGGSKPCECLKIAQCRGKSSAEPLEDGEQKVPSFDEVFKDGEVMGEQNQANWWRGWWGASWP